MCSGFFFLQDLIACSFLLKKKRLERVNQVTKQEMNELQQKHTSVMCEESHMTQVVLVFFKYEEDGTNLH